MSDPPRRPPFRPPTSHRVTGADRTWSDIALVEIEEAEDLPHRRRMLEGVRDPDDLDDEV